AVVSSRAVTTVAGSPGQRVTMDGIGSAARFASPTGITSDGAVNLFVTDSNFVRKVVIATGAVTSVVGPAPPALLQGSFGSLDGVTILSTGELVFADTGANAVYIIR